MSQPTAVLVGLANRTSQFKNAVASLPRQRSLFVLMSRFLSLSLVGCLLAFAVVPLAPAQNLPNTTRLLRFPTTNGRQIVFCYAGELYTVAKEGGTARRITSGPGYTSFPRFSPDGAQLAFTSQYDGNTEVYVMPAEGGAPKRLTTSATLGRDDISNGTTENLTNNPAQDICPMWGPDNRIYFTSDRDGRMNLFAIDLTTKETKQLTTFKDFDIKFPSIGKDSIVFEEASYIWRYDLASGQAAPIPIEVKEDFASGRSAFVDGSKHIESVNLAPDGERAIVVARGDLFSVPMKQGTARNLSKSSTAHERDAIWSPDGKWIAYNSDVTGENELYVRSQDGKGQPQQVTSGADTYYYKPVWSPDSKKLLWADR